MAWPGCRPLRDSIGFTSGYPALTCRAFLLRRFAADASYGPVFRSTLSYATDSYGTWVSMGRYPALKRGAKFGRPLRLRSGQALRGWAVEYPVRKGDCEDCSVAPLGLDGLSLSPTAHAVGCILALLRSYPVKPLGCESGVLRRRYRPGRLARSGTRGSCLPEARVRTRLGCERRPGARASGPLLCG